MSRIALVLLASVLTACGGVSDVLVDGERLADNFSRVFELPKFEP